MHERRQFADCLPQLCAELGQSVLFLERDRDPLGELAAEDLVLSLEVTDVPGQFLLGRAGD